MATDAAKRCSAAELYYELALISGKFAPLVKPGSETSLPVAPEGECFF